MSLIEIIAYGSSALWAAQFGVSIILASHVKKYRGLSDEYFNYAEQWKNRYRQSNGTVFVGDILDGNTLCNDVEIEWHPLVHEIIHSIRHDPLNWELLQSSPGDCTIRIKSPKYSLTLNSYGSLGEIRNSDGNSILSTYNLPGNDVEALKAQIHAWKNFHAEMISNNPGVFRKIVHKPEQSVEIVPLIPEDRSKRWTWKLSGEAVEKEFYLTGRQIELIKENYAHMLLATPNWYKENGQEVPTQFTKYTGEFDTLLTESEKLHIDSSLIEHRKECSEKELRRIQLNIEENQEKEKRRLLNSRRRSGMGAMYADIHGTRYKM